MKLIIVWVYKFLWLIGKITITGLFCIAVRRRALGPAIPLWNKGNGLIKQPVYVGNVAHGIVNAILDEDALGKTYEAVG